MKKDLDVILKLITPETPIEKVLGYCDTAEDFDLIVNNISIMDSRAFPISNSLKQTVKKLVTIAKEENKEITTVYIQKNLEVPYPQALALYESLKNEAHI